MSRVSVEQLDHTGDAGLRVEADSLPLLLCTCAEQMMRICVAEADIACRLERSVAVEAHDLVELFVGWLTEINCSMNIHHEIYGEFQIDELAICGPPPLRLTGTLRGEPIDPRRHVIECEIKAVTYHEAYLYERDGRWHGQIVFDL